MFEWNPWFRASKKILEFVCVCVMQRKLSYSIRFEKICSESYFHLWIAFAHRPYRMCHSWRPKSDETNELSHSIRSLPKAKTYSLRNSGSSQFTNASNITLFICRLTLFSFAHFRKQSEYLLDVVVFAFVDDRNQSETLAKFVTFTETMRRPTSGVAHIALHSLFAAAQPL